MKRATAVRNGTKLQELRAKALRRGDKLAKTLRKLAAKGGSNDVAAAALLKELEQALPRLLHPADQQDGRPAKREARQVNRDPGKARREAPSPPKPKGRKAKPQPASATALAE